MVMIPLAQRKDCRCGARWWQGWLVCLLLVLGLGVRPAGSAQVVRVGFTPLAGFHELDAAEQPRGYDVDYLTEISHHTGWAYRFIPAKDWHTALQMLKKGQIDLIGGALKSPVREDELLYSAYAAGSTHGTLVTLKHREDFVYEDFQSFATLRIGVSRNYARTAQFETYARHNGFTPNLRTYSGTKALRAALHANDIDAMLVSVLDLAPDEKVLARFSHEPFYYMAASDKTALMDKLDWALARIDLLTPDFKTSLMRRHFPRITEIPLTRSERDLITHLPPLRVGYPTAQAPLSSTNQATGEAEGMLPDLMRIIAKESGLRFEMVPLDPPPVGSVSMAPAEALSRASLDMVLGVEKDAVNRVDPAFVLTRTVLVSSMSLFGKQPLEPDARTRGRVAIMADWRSGWRHLAATYPNMQGLSCDTTEACLDAVARGEADWMLGQPYRVNYLLPKPLYSEITAQQQSDVPEEWCIAVTSTAPIRLISVLDKAIGSIPEHRKQQVVAEHLAALTTPINFVDFWAQYRGVAAIIASLLALVTLLVLSALHFWRKNQRDAVDSERRLSAITNNINGGVMTLGLEPELLILYANNGFWQLLGSSRAAVHSPRMADHLPEADAQTLEARIRENRPAGVPLELELHLRHETLGVLPVLFRGTFAMDSTHTPMLYVVVMDITAQKRMQDMLALEKERYRIILEQSNDIVFDIDEEKGEFICSDNFAATFGWQWTESFFLTRGPDTLPECGSPLRTHPDDMPALLEARQRVLSGVRMQTLLLRVPTASEQYRWCRLQLFRISRDDMPIHLIGKIVDVDDTVRERQALERQTQRDSLTDLYNKVAFRECVNSYLKGCRDSEHCSAILFLDMDNFKNLNDTLGHVVGDKALVAVSDVLRRVFRNADAIGRFGGDEFCVFVNHIPHATLLERAAAIQAALRMNYTDGVHTVRVSVSIGIYLLERDETSCEEALRKADEALYAAKQNGRDRFVFYDSAAGMRSQGAGR